MYIFPWYGPEPHIFKIWKFYSICSIIDDYVYLGANFNFNGKFNKAIWQSCMAICKQVTQAPGVDPGFSGRGWPNISVLLGIMVWRGKYGTRKKIWQWGRWLSPLPTSTPPPPPGSATEHVVPCSTY